MKRSTFRMAAAAAVLLSATMGASAQEAIPASMTSIGKDFLAAFAGNWRGSGEARSNPRSAPMRISCRLTAVFDSVQSILSNTGRCGTTKGSREVSGRLLATGGDLKGEFISGVDTSRLQRQRMSLSGNALVVEAEMDNEQGGKVHRLRTVLTKPSGGSFVVQNQFYDWETSAWVSGGEIAFKKQ